MWPLGVPSSQNSQLRRGLGTRLSYSNAISLGGVVLVSHDEHLIEMPVWKYGRIRQCAGWKEGYNSKRQPLRRILQALVIDRTGSRTGIKF